MTMKNKYAKKSHISERKFQQLVRLFAADLDASQIAQLTSLNRNTVNRYVMKIRPRLVRFRGMSPSTFNLHLKECEFRFNHRGQDLSRLILKILRNQPLN